LGAFQGAGKQHQGDHGLNQYLDVWHSIRHPRFVITKFLSFDSAAITSHHPVLATVVSFGGMALILYLLLIIRHFDARVRGDLERAQACEPYVTGLAEVTESSDQHDAKISTLASRLEVFAYFYLAAFLAAIVYIWARRS